MDFLSRLIGANGAPSRKSSTTNSPQQRLARFKKTYNQVLQAYNRTKIAEHDPAAIDTVRVSLQRLTNLIQDDTRAPAPHLCLSFASSYQVYSGLASIATSLKNKDVIREVVSIFSVLVDSDEEALLENESFARELMRFIRNLTDGRIIRLGSEAEGEVLELAFSIAAKIRLEPDLLPIWFRPTHSASVSGSEDAATTFDNNAFPLCYQFVENVYNEGRAGDFARTGLLYIFESATHYNGLEAWIVNSDLPTMMASGLGALYSQLSRKISIAHPDDRLPLILALSDNDVHQAPGEADSFYSENLQARLSTFMSNLVFWQDILEHCRSLEIKQTLIDHFQVFFLQQILYPSLLESSDLDGGSAVAVLTYLWRILDSVDHPDLIHLILKYLLAIEDSFTAARASSVTQSTEQRKASMKQRLEDRGGDDTLNPSLFNLIDLVNAGVRSANVETITAALRLVSVMLKKHHQHAISSLVRSVPFRATSLSRSFGSLRYDLETYLTLAESIGGIEGMNEAYENCVKDGATIVETHVCSSSKIGLDTTNAADSKRRGAILDNRPKDLHDHLLLPEDPLLQSLMDLMKTFFTNDIETNIGLTDVISQLAACPYTRLEGWLVVDPPQWSATSSTSAEAGTELPNSQVPVEQLTPGSGSDAANGPSGDLQSGANPEEMNEDARVTAFKVSTVLPVVIPQTEAPFVRILRDLDSQLAEVKEVITEMNHFISGRKRAFQGATELENEMRSSAPSIISPKLGNTRESSQTRSDVRGRGIKASTGLERSRGNTREGARSSSSSPSFRSRDPSLRPTIASNPTRIDVLETRSKSPLHNVVNIDGHENASTGVEHLQSNEHEVAGSVSAEGVMQDEDDEEEEIFERLLKFTPKIDTGIRQAELGSRAALDEQRESVYQDSGKSGQSKEVAKEAKSVQGKTRKSKAPKAPSVRKRTQDLEDKGRASGGLGAVNGQGEDRGLEKGVTSEEAKSSVSSVQSNDGEREATVNHVLTNVIILQEFILEIAGIVQVRSSLLDGEIKFL